MRFDRDKYLDIDWEWIPLNYLQEFAKLPESTFPSYDVPYNYQSIMQWNRDVVRWVSGTIRPKFGFGENEAIKRLNYNKHALGGTYVIDDNGKDWFQPTTKPTATDILWMKRFYGCGKFHIFYDSSTFFSIEFFFIILAV